MHPRKLESGKAGIKLIGVAALALLLAACSLTRVAYNNAGVVLTYMVDDYFDLSGVQEDWVRERLDRSVLWHRSNQLPEYDRFLAETLERTQRPITVADARWLHVSVRTYYQRLVEQLLPDAAELLLQLDAEQVGHFERRFGEANDKIVKEQLKPAREQRDARRTRRYVETIEGFTGRLSAEQRELVGSRVRNLQDLTAMRLEDRRARQRQLVEIARARAPKEQTIAGLRRLLVDTQSWRDPAYAAAMKQRDEQIFEMAVAVAATLTPEQLGQVRDKVRSYRRDISSLLASR